MSITCPICRAPAGLVRHCPETNVACDWARCTKCHVTIDRLRRRGFDRSNQPVVWPTAGP